MRTLGDINTERRKLIYEATKKIRDKRKIGVHYSTAQLSEMCDGLVPPEIFKRTLSRAVDQAYRDKQGGSGAREWKTECTYLFGAWNLRFKAYPVGRMYTVKWFDEDGRLFRTTERLVHDYEAEFVVD